MFFNIKSKLVNNFEPLLFKMLLNILQNPRIHFPLESLMLLISNGERSLWWVRSLVKCKQRSTYWTLEFPTVCDKLPMMVNIYFLGVAWETHLLLALCLVRKLLRWVLILKFYWKKKYWYWGKLDLEKPFPLTIPSPHFVCISSLLFLIKL